MPHARTWRVNVRQLQGWGDTYEGYVTHETPWCRVRTVQRAASVRMSAHGPRALATAVASIISNVQQHQQCCRMAPTSADKRHCHPACSTPSKRLPSKHARSSEAGECRGAGAACLHEHSCRGCSWRSCTAQCPSAGRDTLAHSSTARLSPVLANHWADSHENLTATHSLIKRKRRRRRQAVAVARIPT